MNYIWFGSWEDSKLSTNKAGCSEPCEIEDIQFTLSEDRFTRRENYYCWTSTHAPTYTNCPLFSLLFHNWQFVSTLIVYLGIRILIYNSPMYTGTDHSVRILPIWLQVGWVALLMLHSNYINRPSLIHGSPDYYCGFHTRTSICHWQPAA